MCLIIVDFRVIVCYSSICRKSLKGLSKLKCKEILDRLNEVLPFKVHKHTILWFDNIGLVRCGRDGNGHRRYSEKQYGKLRHVLMLSYLGVELRLIDRALNKKIEKAQLDLREIIITKDEVVGKLWKEWIGD